jgi:DNA-binding NarL/FixJ family response regulator
MAPAKRHCLVIGRHLLLLDGLRNLLEPEFEVLTLGANCDSVLAAAATFRPDVAIIDADAGEVSREVGIRLIESYRALEVTYLTSDTDPSLYGVAVSKTRPASDLLRLVTMGRDHVARIAQSTEGTPSESCRGHVRLAANLSDRERQVLVRLVRGQSMKTVARELGITPRTVAFHKYNAMAANGLRNNADLIVFALRHKILPPAKRPVDEGAEFSSSPLLDNSRYSSAGAAIPSLPVQATNYSLTASVQTRS